MGFRFLHDAPTPFLGILVAIAGAIVGGVIALLIQLVALFAASRDKAKERKLVQQQLGYSLLFKLSRIASDFVQIHQHLEECCAVRPEGQLWERIVPLGNLPLPINFSADEMALLLLQKDDDVFNAVVSLDGAHSSVIDILRLYREQRASLTQQLPRAKAIEGQLVSHFLDKEQMLALAPALKTVEMIAEQLRDLVARDAKDARLSLEKTQELLRKRLGVSFRFDFAGLAKAIAPAARSP